MKTRKKYILTEQKRTGEKEDKTILGVFSSRKKAKAAMLINIKEYIQNNQVISEINEPTFTRLDFIWGYLVLRVRKVEEDSILLQEKCYA